jgi:hypothetical protein
MLHPRVLWGYLKLIWRGTRPEKPESGEDLFQLGGDFVLDEAVRLVFAYPSKTSTDRPSVAVLSQSGKPWSKMSRQSKRSTRVQTLLLLPLSDWCL